MNRIPEEAKELSEAIIGAAIEVHKGLGPGLLESAYSQWLACELSKRGIPFQREVELPVAYKEVKLDCGYRMDFVVAGKILLELKSVETVTALHDAQLLTYLKLSGLRIGLILNFNALTLRDGITRRVL